MKLGPCEIRGRPGLSFGVLASAWPSPKCLGEQISNGSYHFLLLVSIFLPFKYKLKNKLLKSKTMIFENLPNIWKPNSRSLSSPCFRDSTDNDVRKDLEPNADKQYVKHSE